MSLADLDNLVSAGKLKREPPNQDEFDGLIEQGEAKYRDAQITSLSLVSRFDLVYGASHAFALAAAAVVRQRVAGLGPVQSSGGQETP
jgi:hypothetical protein